MANTIKIILQALTSRSRLHRQRLEIRRVSQITALLIKMVPSSATAMHLRQQQFHCDDCTAYPLTSADCSSISQPTIYLVANNLKHSFSLLMLVLERPSLSFNGPSISVNGTTVFGSDTRVGWVCYPMTQGV